MDLDLKLACRLNGAIEESLIKFSVLSIYFALQSYWSNKSAKSAVEKTSSLSGFHSVQGTGRLRLHMVSSWRGSLCSVADYLLERG